MPGQRGVAAAVVIKRKRRREGEREREEKERGGMNDSTSYEHGGASSGHMKRVF